MVAEITEKCLLLFFKSPLELAWAELPNDAPVAIVYKNQTYKNIGTQGWNGFYDWLRNYQNKIVGVRYFPFEDFEMLATLINQLPDCKVVTNNKGAVWFDLFFSSDRSVNEKKSDDQDFGGNWLFQTESGDKAMSLIARDNEKLFKALERLQWHESTS
jgi:hypothetical protein